MASAPQYLVTAGLEPTGSVNKVLVVAFAPDMFARPLSSTIFEPGANCDAGEPELTDAPKEDMFENTRAAEAVDVKRPVALL